MTLPLEIPALSDVLIALTIFVPMVWLLGRWLDRAGKKTRRENTLKRVTVMAKIRAKQFSDEQWARCDAANEKMRCRPCPRSTLVSLSSVAKLPDTKKRVRNDDKIPFAEVCKNTWKR